MKIATTTARVCFTVIKHHRRHRPVFTYFSSFFKECNPNDPREPRKQYLVLAVQFLQTKIFHTGNDSGQFDADLLAKWTAVKELEENGFGIRLGDLVTVQGKIRIFRHRRQIVCQNISEYNPASESVKNICCWFLICPPKKIVQATFLFAGKETDPMCEAWHLLQMVELHKNLYDQPAKKLLDSSSRLHVCCLSSIITNGSFTKKDEISSGWHWFSK